MELIRAFDPAPGYEFVYRRGADAQIAIAQHPVDARILGAQLDEALGDDARKAAPTLRLRGGYREHDDGAGSAHGGREQ